MEKPARLATLRKDSHGFTLTNLPEFISDTRVSDPPITLPKQAEKIFFSEDFDDPNWRVLLRKYP